MKAVIYARYSSDNQREESIEGQLRECKGYAEKNGITVLTTYIDRALSAKTDNRPEFQKMIKDSSKNLFDIVLVWKLDRFARNRYDSAHYKSILRKNRVKVVSAMETIADDSTGILLESLLEGYAEFYSAELAEKVKRGQTENALKGKSNGGRPAFGYTLDKERYYQINPITVPIVLEVFNAYASGKTIKMIVDDLNNRGIKNSAGGKFTINIITAMLKNRKYIGEYRFADVFVPNGIPQIVPSELFERVAVRMEKNKRAPARTKAKGEMYLLTSKLFCGTCGGMMVGECGRSHTNRIYQYYKCITTKRRKGCHRKAIKKDWIEELVIQQIRKVIFDDNLIDALADMLLMYQTRENSDLPLFKQQLAKTEKAIQNMLNAIQQGIFTTSTKERLEELENEKSNLEIRILQNQIKEPTFTKEQIIFWLHRFREYNITNEEQKQQLIDIFINAVYVYDDKIIFTFNYKDETKTINLDDIEGSDFDRVGAPGQGGRCIKQRLLLRIVTAPFAYCTEPCFSDNAKP